MRVPERVGAKRLARGRTPIDGAFLRRDPGLPHAPSPVAPHPSRCTCKTPWGQRAGLATALAHAAGVGVIPATPFSLGWSKAQ